MQYFIYVDRDRYGPYDLAYLQMLIDRDALLPDRMVETADGTQIRAEQIRGLRFPPNAGVGATTELGYGSPGPSPAARAPAAAPVERRPPVRSSPSNFLDQHEVAPLQISPSGSYQAAPPRPAKPRDARKKRLYLVLGGAAAGVLALVVTLVIVLLSGNKDHAEKGALPERFCTGDGAWCQPRVVSSPSVIFVGGGLGLRSSPRMSVLSTNKIIYVNGKGAGLIVQRDDDPDQLAKHPGLYSFYIHGDLNERFLVEVYKALGKAKPRDLIFSVPDPGHLMPLRELKDRVIGLAVRGKGSAEGIHNLKYFTRAKSVVVLGVSNETMKYIGKLKHLTSLTVAGTRYHQIDDEGLRYLTRLKSLEYLEITTRRLAASAIHRLAKLPKLKSLTIRATALDKEALEAIEKMTRLEHLAIVGQGSNVTEELRLGRLKHLRSLALQGNFAGTRGKHLAQLKQLRELRLRGAMDAHLFGYLRLQPHLESLVLYPQAADCLGKGLDRLAELKSLRRLVIQSKSVHQGELAGVCALQQLEALDVTLAQGVEVECLAQLTALRRLKIDVEGHLASKTLLGPFKRLEELSLDNVTLSRADLGTLGKRKRLRGLQLMHAGVTDEHLEALGKLPDLRYLDLDANYVTDAGLDGLGKSTSLRAVDLSRTFVSGAGIARLAKANRLQSVVANHTVLRKKWLASRNQIREFVETEPSGFKAEDTGPILARLQGFLPELRRRCRPPTTGTVHVGLRLDEHGNIRHCLPYRFHHVEARVGQCICRRLGDTKVAASGPTELSYTFRLKQERGCRQPGVACLTMSLPQELPRHRYSDPKRYYDVPHAIMVQREPAREMTEFYKARNYCRDLTLAGYSDWRLPLEEELDQFEKLYASKVFHYDQGVYWSSKSWKSRSFCPPPADPSQKKPCPKESKNRAVRCVRTVNAYCLPGRSCLPRRPRCGVPDSACLALKAAACKACGADSEICKAKLFYASATRARCTALFAKLIQAGKSHRRVESTCRRMNRWSQSP